MADQYLWQAGNILTPSGMASTIKLNDGVSGDKTTAETVTNSPPAAIVLNEMTAMIVFASLTNVTSITFTVGSTGYSGNDGAHGTTGAIEYYNGTWNALGSDTNFDVGFIVTPFDKYETFTIPVNVNATRIRAYITGNFHQAGPVTMATGASDFRYTGTLVPVDVVLSASVSLSLSAGTMPAMQARKGLVLSYVVDIIEKTFLSWQKDCSSKFSVITKDCSSKLSHIAKDCSANFSRITKSDK